MLLKPDVANFISRLEARIRNEGIFTLVMKDPELSKGMWDKAVRKRVGKVLKEIFQESFPKEGAETVYIEGEGSPKSWKPPYDLFGSKGVYPDMAILKPKRIAIELDHSEIRRKEIHSSKLKMALAKASSAT